MTRDEAFYALAAAKGWNRIAGKRVGAFNPYTDTNLYLPAPDAPLHEHLAFVGRVAEAIGADPALYRQKFESDGEVVNGWCVYFEIGDQIEGEGLDLCHAALLAALAALEAR